MITHPQAFIYLCLSFISGIFIGSFFYLEYIIYILIIIGLSLIGILWKEKHVFLIMFLILVFTLGYFYINNTTKNILDNEINKYFNTEIVAKGKVAKYPKDDLKIKKAIIEVSEVNGERNKASILIHTNQDLNFNEEVIIIGKLEKPENFSNFDYKMYLANQGISGIIKNPELEIASGSNFFIFDFKKKAEDIVLKNLSINKAGMLNATILGETDNMNLELKQKLGFTGISHVIAISGQHIVLLCVILLSFLSYIKVERKRSIIITFLFLLFYIVLIDFPASGLRAFIMMSFVLFAELVGRQTDSLRSLIISAVLILAFNPLALVYDLGFQLSFFAVLGIMFFNKFFKSKLSFIKNGFLNDLVSVNFSAQVFVLPLLIYTFEYVSLSSFITNILIVPVSTIMLVLGFLCVVLALIFPSIAYLLFAPLSVILGYILLIVNIFSPMILEVRNIPLVFIFIVYLILGFLAYKLRRNKFEFYFGN